MKQILSLLLLCSLPITTLGNAPARQVGTAVIQLIDLISSKCIVSHTMPLLENSDNEKTIAIIGDEPQTINIKLINTEEASISIKSDIKSSMAELTVTYLRPLREGSIGYRLPYLHKAIAVRLTKRLLSSEQTSDTNNPDDVESKK